MIKNRNSFYFIAVGFFLLPLLIFAQSPPGLFEGGNGSPDNPYQISTCRQLQNIGTGGSLDRYFVLVNNIDCSESVNWEGGRGFKPIGNKDNKFTGSFDGREYVISDLYIRRGNNSYQGLFASIGPLAEIKNVGLENVDITGLSLVGALAGRIEGATVKDSYATGSIEGKGNTVGGLAGEIERAGFEENYANTVISDSYFSGNVLVNSVLVGGLVGNSRYGLIIRSYSEGKVENISNRAWTGGLIGRMLSSVIFNSYSKSEVRSKGIFVGGLVGQLTNSSFIENSYATGDVYGSSRVGGLVGESAQGEGTVIHRSYATGNVEGGYYTGGLIGYSSSDIDNSYATGNVKGSHFSGGLAGYLYKNVIANSYSIGEVTSSGSRVGGLVGRIERWGANSSFWNIETSGRTKGVGCCGWREEVVVGKTTDEMKDIATFTQTVTYGLSEPWKFVGISDDGYWNMDDSGVINDGYPFLAAIEGIYEPLFEEHEMDLFEGGDGSENNPYQIVSCEQLQNMKAALMSYFVLLNNIDCSATIGWNNGAGFEPVGDKSNGGFFGSLDGKGYKISDLYINKPNAIEVGLFGFLRTGVIKNLKLENVNIAGGELVGSLAGRSRGIIKGVSVTGNIESGTRSVGGLVGGNSGTILYSHSGANVAGNNKVGGLVGDNTGTIMNSHTTGNVSGSGIDIGGLVGIVGGWKPGDKEEAKCVAVEDDPNYDSPGKQGWSQILSSYSISPVNEGKSGSYVGGLIGHREGDAETINSFWDREASGQNSSAGGTRKTTAEMKDQSTFTSADWNFSGVWKMGISGYPVLENDISLFSIKGGRSIFLVNAHFGKPPELGGISERDSDYLPVNLPLGNYNVNIITRDGYPDASYREGQFQPNEIVYLKLFDSDKNLIAETRNSLNLKDCVRFSYHEETLATNVSIPKEVAYIRVMHGATDDQLETHYNSLRVDLVSFDLLSDVKAKEGDSLVLLNSERAVLRMNELLRSDLTGWDARVKRPVEIGLAPGNYNIHVAALDEHDRAWQDQPDESFFLRFLNRAGNVVATTVATTDLEDGVDRAYLEETIEEDFYISSDFHSFDAYHAAHYDPNPNSFYILGVAFDFSSGPEDIIVDPPSSILVFGEERRLSLNQNVYWYAGGILGGDGLEPGNSGVIEPSQGTNATYTAPYGAKQQVIIETLSSPDGNIINEVTLAVREPYNRLSCQPVYDDGDFKIWLGWNSFHNNPYLDHELRLYKVSPGEEEMLGQFDPWQSGSYLHQGLTRQTKYTYELGIRYLEGDYAGEEFRVAGRTCETPEGASDAPSRVRAFARDDNRVYVNWKDNVTLPNSNYSFEVQRIKATPLPSANLIMEESPDFPGWLSLSWRNATNHISYFHNIEYSTEKDSAVRFTAGDQSLRKVGRIGETWPTKNGSGTEDFSLNIDAGEMMEEGAVLYVRQNTCPVFDFVEWPYMEEERMQMILNKGADGQPRPPCSEYRYFQTVITAPNAPTGLSSDGKTHDSISLIWQDNSEQEDGFELERTSGGVTSKLIIPASSPPSATGEIGYVDGGLSRDTAYSYRVRAFAEDDGGSRVYSGYSNTISVTTDAEAAAPNTPTNLSSYNETHNSISLSWQDNSDQEDGFVLERWRGGSLDGTVELGPSSPPSATGEMTHTDSGLLQNTAYSYRIRAFINDPIQGRVYSGYSNTLSVSTRDLGRIEILSFISGSEVSLEDNNDCGATLERQGSGWTSSGDCIRTEEDLLPGSYILSWDEGYPTGAARFGEPEVIPAVLELDYEEEKGFEIRFVEEVKLTIGIVLDEEHLTPLRGGIVQVNLPGGGDFACDYRDQPCVVEYPKGFSINAKATPYGGYSFDRWIAGPCQGSTNRECDFGMSDNIGITAEFKWGEAAWFSPRNLLASLTRPANLLMGNIQAGLSSLFGRAEREFITLTDNGSVNEEGHRKYYKSSAAVSPPIPFYEDKGLDPDTVYLYRVRVVYPDGSTSSWSINEAMVKTLKDKAGGPLSGNEIRGVCTRNSFCDRSMENIGIGVRSSVDSGRLPAWEQTEQQCTLNIHCQDIGRSDIRFIER